MRSLGLLESIGGSSFKRNMLFALLVSGAFGSLTLAAEKLSAISENPIIGAPQRILFALLYPGIFGSMVFSGNAHAWSLWIAAGINGLIYFGLAWLAFRSVAGLFRRVFGDFEPR